VRGIDQLPFDIKMVTGITITSHQSAAGAAKCFAGQPNQPETKAPAEPKVFLPPIKMG
jgi:hypothetical protein